MFKGIKKNTVFRLVVLTGVTLLFVGKLQAQATLPSGATIELSPAADADSSVSIQNNSRKLYGQLSALNSIHLSNPGLPLPAAIEQSQTGNVKARLPTLIDETHVMVDAVATDGNVGDLRAKLEGLGLRKTAVFGTVVSGEFPVTALNDAADIDTLNFMKAAVARKQAGSVQSQAGLSMNAEGIVVDGAVLDGTGVKVGVLSDSYDLDPFAFTSAADDIASGDLPPADRITILDDSIGFGSDEGRAMMQLIHDVAPDADLSFHTAFTGQAGFAEGIVALADDGADIIVDDVFYLDEPWFQDGVIAQAVDQVVDGGAAYFSAAGNSANDSYEADYVDGGESARYPGLRGLVKIHDIDPTTDGTQVHTFTAQPGEGWFIVLQWDTPFASAGGAGANNDVDMLVTDADFNIVFNAANFDNIGGDGFEIVGGFWTGPLPQEFALIIGVAEGSSGPLPGRIKFSNYDFAPATFSPALNGGTIIGHANAEGALAVGAAYYEETPAFGTNPPLLESFSSHGGTSVLLDTNGNPLSAPDDRMKPEFVAPDGVDTTFFGFDSDENGFPNFFGTSAAAPNAAAAAALMVEANPSITPAQIESSLQSGAIDMNSAGFDYQSGAGLIDLGNSISTEQLCEEPTGIVPPKGAALSEGSELLSWDNTNCEYWVYIGTAADTDAYADSGSLGNATSYTLTGYPSDGSTVRVTLFYRSLDGGAWSAKVLNYIAPGGSGCGVPSEITPEDGATLVSNSQLLSWNDTNCEYWVYAGTSAGDRSYADSGNLGTSTSYTFSGYPSDGSAVAVTLYYRPTTGGRWNNVVLNYVAPNGGGECSAPTGISPADGSTISADSQLLTWDDTGCIYWVYAGTEPKSKDYDDSGNLGTATSYSFSGYPTGADVVVTLYYKPPTAGSWQYVTLDYTVPASTPTP